MIKLNSAYNPLIRLAILMCMGFIACLVLGSRLTMISGVYVIIVMGISVMALNLLLLGKNWQDFFGESETDRGSIFYQEIMVLGQRVSTANDEEEAFERELRLTSPIRNKIKMALVALVSFLSVMLVSQMTRSRISLISLEMIAPLVIGGFLIFSKTKERLLLACLVQLIFSVLLVSRESLYYSLVPLFVFFWQLRIVGKMNLRKPLEQNSQSLNALGKAILPAAILFCMGDFLIPKSFWTKTPPKERLSSIEKVNKSLGKKLKGPSVVDIAKNKELLKEFREKSQGYVDAKMATDYLNTMNKGLSEIYENMNVEDFESRGDFNLMKNELNELKGEMKEFEDIASSQNWSDLSSKEKMDFQKSFKKLSEKIASFEGRHKGKGQQLGAKKEFDSLISGKKFSEDLATTGSGLSEKDFESIKKAIKESDAQNIEKNLNEAISTFEKEREVKETDQALIEPKLLKSIVGAVKRIAALLIILFAGNVIFKFFKKDDIQIVEDGDEVLLKKKLLYRKRYATQKEEINELYLNYAHAAKKIHFPEEEIPPPRILGDSLDFLRERRKEIYFLCEVFSHSYYNDSYFSKDQMKKYRLAYRRIIKSL